MRKVIETINDGQINRKFGALTFSVDQVEHTVKSGVKCEGSFSVLATTNNLTEGYVYSDDYRMECISSYFTGSQDEIAYRFHAENLSAGQDIRGNFVIISNRGEYLIPFVIHIEPEVFDSSIGPIRNVFHFTNLAKANWDEALKVFYTPGFERVFTGSDREYLPIYRALSGIKGSARNMDEFLVSLRKKTPVEFIPSEQNIEVNDPVGMSRFSFNISRNGWGYTQLFIKTEGEFLSVDTQTVSLESFLGNNLQIYYYIDSDRLHPGKNYGAIILADDRFETRIPVQVNLNRNGNFFKNMTMTRMKGIVRIMELYQSFRLKKINTRMWIAETSSIIESMLVNDPEDLIFRLYQIQLMITQERTNEANWNLRAVKQQAESIRDDKPHLWCYYLYLNSLVDSDAGNLRDYEDQVAYYYKMNPDSWRITWLLTYMSDEYQSITRRWVMYENSYYKGCHSPVLFMEAARIVLDNPSIISKIDSFELQVLRYIIKKEVLSEDIVFVIKSLAERCKDYSPRILELLELCYRDHPQDDLLTIICGQLIKGNRTDSGAFVWYGYAVKQELKITRLYEYYMMSIDKREPVSIPRIVLMYFSFHSDLDYETNAYLYASVVNDRLNDSEMYARYQPQIERFVDEQLAAGHNNRYLAVLYKALIDDLMLIDDTVASRVADVIFMHEVDTSNYPDVRNVILCYEYHDGEEVYPVVNGLAVLPIYSNSYCLAFEDEFHNRTVATRKITPVQLMPPGRLLLNLQFMLKRHVGIDVHCCMEHQLSADIRPENEFRFRNLLEMDYFSLEFARAVTMKLVRFYSDQERFEELDQFLEELNSDYVAEYERAECIGYLVRRSLYDKAVNWIYKYGPEGIEESVICDLINGWLPVHRNDTEQYRDLVQQLLLETLGSNRSNMVNVQYLINNAVGTSKILRDIWRKASEIGVEHRDLEEKMIIQLLYSGAYLSEKGGIIENYAYNLPDGDVLRAALNSSSYEYFVDDVMISDKIFGVLTDAFETELDLDRVCDLAYVKFYAENKDRIDDKVKPVLKDALHRLMANGVVMACFRELSDIMPSMTSYADMTIVEYRTQSDSQVSIHYVIESDREDEYHSEQMQEVYKGVYSSAFTLFFGEKLMYYITEGSEDENDALSESNSIMRSDIGDSISKGRFGLVNDICIGKTLRDYATVDELLLEFFSKEYMSEKLFGMHKG